MVAQADVASADETARMFDQAWTAFARLDIPVNNVDTQVWKPLVDLEEAEWDRVIATNLKGCFLCTQLAARHMRQHVGRDAGQGRGGRIVNIGSGCNKMPFPIWRLTRRAKAESRCSPR